MLIVPEREIASLVAMENAIAAVEAAFAAADRERAHSYPVVREILGHADAVFGIKSGFDAEGAILGLKAGGYWPGNAARGLGNHQSTVLLFDPDTGRARALVGGNLLTALRTGAASALATRYLARPEARTLGIIGTGGQAPYQLRANLLARPFARVLAWDPSADNLARFREQVEETGLEFAAPGREAVAREADVLITITPSQAPLVEKGWVRPGTHINAMGADTAGKQELDPALVAAAQIFVDSPEQAATIGECQHAARLGLLAPRDLAGTLGGLASGRLTGRRDAEAVTLFDGTGIALQDLAVAALALRRAQEAGRCLEVPLA